LKVLTFFFNFWNFKFFNHFEIFWKFWNLVKFWKVLWNFLAYWLAKSNFCEIIILYKFSNFMKFSSLLISKTQFLCNKKPYCTLVPRNFIHWFCTRVQYDYLLHRNCFLLINMLENGMYLLLLIVYLTDICPIYFSDWKIL
jgi:hypothetical protein